MMSRALEKFPAPNYRISGEAVRSIWRDCYERLIDESKPLRGDDRRDIAQRLGALLEGNCYEAE